MTTRARVTKVTVMTLDESLPPVAQAAALALRVLQRARVDTWAELAEKIAGEDEKVLETLAGIHLDDEQRALLAAYPHVVAAVGYQAPRRTIAVCSVCHELIVVAGAVPATCDMTLGCGGEYAKVQPAKAELVPAEEIDRAEEDPVARSWAAEAPVASAETRPDAVLGDLDDEEEFEFP